MRFELIDNILEQEKDRLLAIKNVTQSEEYLADHFPGFPILPGVMMLETLVQAGRALLADRTGDLPLILTQARNVRYANMVKPGQALQVQVRIRKQTDTSWQFEGSGTVGGLPAVTARFTLEPLKTD